jgi:hypothetical protein
MTLLRATLCLIAGAGLLSACSKPANQAAGAGGVVISQADLPKLKPGLWEISVSNDGKPPTISQHCETGERVGMAAMSKACSKLEFRRSALGVITIDAICGTGDYSSTMHMTVSGDYDSKIAGDGLITLNNPDHAPTAITTHSESHYLGPCPAGG